MKFKQGLDPRDTMNTGIIKDKNANEKMIIGLNNMYSDYKRDGIIKNLSQNYSRFITTTYLRKLADLGIIKRMSKSRKNMMYMWNAGENPDFQDLTNSILMARRIDEPDLSKDYSIDIAILLSKAGVEDDKIRDLTNKIIELFKH